MHRTYYLADPREPTAARYFGSTSQPLTKRLSDHHSAARHRSRRGLVVTPVMHWLLALDKEDVTAHIGLVAEFEFEEDAKDCEDALIKLFVEDILNVGVRGGGRPVGTRDSDEARERKAAAQRASQFSNRAIKINYQRRLEQGYPHPELPVTHLLNDDHNRFLNNKPPRRRVFKKKLPA